MFGLSPTLLIPLVCVVGVRPLPNPHPSLGLSTVHNIALPAPAIGLVPAPEPDPEPIHVSAFDDVKDMPSRIIVGYRTVCQNGVCQRVPIYADVPPATPGHTHEALGGRLCDLCGRSCYMIRAAEAAAAAKGEYSDEAVRREYQARYGSGRTRQPVRVLRRFRR